MAVEQLSPSSARPSLTPDADAVQMESAVQRRCHEADAALVVRPNANARPIVPRSATDPGLTLVQSFAREAREVKNGGLRNRSPYAMSSNHMRRHGSAGSLPASLTRTHSSPAFNTRKGLDANLTNTSSSTTCPTSSASPSPRSQIDPFARLRPSSRPPRDLEDSEENITANPTACVDTSNGTGAFAAIQEDSELYIDPQAPSSYLPPLHAIVPRSSSLRRRPISPLHTATGPPQSSRMGAANFGEQPTSAGHSPSIGPLKYNESYPSLHHHGSSASMASSYSSLPSTPSSARSRSPSISSLGTIEDVPDLETEAMELDRLERLHAATEKTTLRADVDDCVRRRSSFDTPRSSVFSRGRSEQRKRWSVCGAERRADLDLETIWED